MGTVPVLPARNGSQPACCHWPPEIHQLGAVRVTLQANRHKAQKIIQKTFYCSVSQCASQSSLNQQTIFILDPSSLNGRWAFKISLPVKFRCYFWMHSLSLMCFFDQIWGIWTPLWLSFAYLNLRRNKAGPFIHLLHTSVGNFCFTSTCIISKHFSTW